MRLTLHDPSGEIVSSIEVEERPPMRGGSVRVPAQGLDPGRWYTARLVDESGRQWRYAPAQPTVRGREAVIELKVAVIQEAYKPRWREPGSL